LSRIAPLGQVLIVDDYPPYIPEDQREWLIQIEPFFPEVGLGDHESDQELARIRRELEARI